MLFETSSAYIPLFSRKLNQVPIKDNWNIRQNPQPYVYTYLENIVKYNNNKCLDLYFKYSLIYIIF